MGDSHSSVSQANFPNIVDNNDNNKNNNLIDQISTALFMITMVTTTVLLTAVVWLQVTSSCTQFSNSSNTRLETMHVTNWYCHAAGDKHLYAVLEQQQAQIALGKQHI